MVSSKTKTTRLENYKKYSKSSLTVRIASTGIVIAFLGLIMSRVYWVVIVIVMVHFQWVRRLVVWAIVYVDYAVASAVWIVKKVAKARGGQRAAYIGVAVWASAQCWTLIVMFEFGMEGRVRCVHFSLTL